MKIHAWQPYNNIPKYSITLALPYLCQPRSNNIFCFENQCVLIFLLFLEVWNYVSSRDEDNYNMFLMTRNYTYHWHNKCVLYVRHLLSIRLNWLIWTWNLLTYMFCVSHVSGVIKEITQHATESCSIQDSIPGIPTSTELNLFKLWWSL